MRLPFARASKSPPAAAAAAAAASAATSPSQLAAAVRLLIALLAFRSALGVDSRGRGRGDPPDDVRDADDASESPDVVEAAESTCPDGNGFGFGFGAAAAAADALFDEAVEAWRADLVDRVPHREMDRVRYMNEYQRRRRPVVLTGVYDDSPLTEGVDEDGWGWAALRDRFGDVTVETMVDRFSAPSGSAGRRRRGGSCTGAGLCEGRPTKLRDLIDAHFLGVSSSASASAATSATTKVRNGTVPYPHDLELRTVLPEMFDVYRKPALFAENLLLPAKDGEDRWPSLFLGAAGTKTGLHVDSMGTSFTMAVFRGRKQFLLFDAVDGPNLCMDEPYMGLDYGLGSDPFRPDFGRCPNARSARATIADVRPGDVLFVPGSYHHAARNLIGSVGVSQNFLTVSDYDSVMESFLGYAAETKRKRERDRRGTNEGTTTTTSVTIDFLSARDLFRLLSETDYRSSWDDGPRFLCADAATAESFGRVLRHLERVLHDKPESATRLAYLSNSKTHRLALDAGGIWDCIDPRTRDALLVDPIGSYDLTLIDKAFESPRRDDERRCREKFRRYMAAVEREIGRNVPQLDRERRLTKKKPARARTTARTI